MRYTYIVDQVYYVFHFMDTQGAYSHGAYGPYDSHGAAQRTATGPNVHWIVRRSKAGELSWLGPFGSKGAAKRSKYDPDRDIIVGFSFGHFENLQDLMHSELDRTQLPLLPLEGNEDE